MVKIFMAYNFCATTYHPHTDDDHLKMVETFVYFIKIFYDK